MHALEILVNGQRQCVAAPGDGGLILSNIVMTGSLSNPGKCSVQLRLGGVRNDQHREWLQRRLSLGDTVEIRFIDTPQSDPPLKIEPITAAQNERLRIASGDNVA